MAHEKPRDRVLTSRARPVFREILRAIASFAAPGGPAHSVLSDRPDSGESSDAIAAAWGFFKEKIDYADADLARVANANARFDDFL
eukprot:5990-Pyramimonas_sp.AAC.1